MMEMTFLIDEKFITDTFDTRVEGVGVAAAEVIDSLRTVADRFHNDGDGNLKSPLSEWGGSTRRFFAQYDAAGFVVVTYGSRNGTRLAVSRMPVGNEPSRRHSK